MKIFESTYYVDKDKHPINSEWLQLEVVSLWDFKSPIHAIKDRIGFTLKNKKMLYNNYHLSTDAEISSEIKSELIIMGYKIHKNFE